MSSVGKRAGTGIYQEVETPRPLVSAQKVTRKTKTPQEKPRDGAEQERARRKHSGGGKEARNWRHDYPRDQQRPGRRLRPAGGGVVQGMV